MGSSCSETQAEQITESSVRTGAAWLLADGDQAGERMPESALKLFARFRFVRWVKLDEGKQPTDVSPEELHRMLSVV